MRFPRRTRLLRNPFDATAYAAVFFLMVIFLSLGSRLYTPGVRIELPEAVDQPGIDQPSILVALDAEGRFYCQNQAMDSAVLKELFTSRAKQSPDPLTLVILMDKRARLEDLMLLQSLAREAGITAASIATQPGPASLPKP